MIKHNRVAKHRVTAKHSGVMIKHRVVMAKHNRMILKHSEEIINPFLES